MRNLIGRRVEYTGDVANAARSGAVEEIVTDRWGTAVVVRWDDPKTIGWDEQDPVHRVQETSKVDIRIISESYSPGCRFYWS